MVNAEMSKMEITSTTAAVESIEFGCVAHSIILGLSLGLQGELSTATNLLIVFLLHQLLEAICLSHLIASLQNRMEMIIMCTLTVGSMPVGIAIGIIISQSANGTKAAADLAPITSGIACVAGGMLLYSSLINIIADDVKRPQVIESKRLKVGMLSSLLLGALAMTALAGVEVATGGHNHR